MSVKVGVVKGEKAEYPKVSPFHPSQKYPEYPFADEIAAEPNYVYEALRQLFVELGYDRENFGTPDWNPLGFLISPGMSVVIKPNFVRSWHSERKDIYSMITHPSVLRAIADYVWIALAGEGTIVIADAPQYDGNWEELLKVTKLDEIARFYNDRRDRSFALQDLRNYWSRGKHFPSMLIPLDGDPQGTVTVNLGEESAVSRIRNPKQLYGAVYHRQELIRNHTGDEQNYELSGSVMKADVVISVPKLKTHKKVGVTMNIKGLVGACTNKNLIVHYSLGTKEVGGDQYPPNHFTPVEERLIKIERWMYDTFLAKRSKPLEYVHRSIYWLHGTFIRPFGIKVEKHKRLLDVGNWHGNDSAWRMCVDLLKILVFAASDGTMRETPQRRLFSVIDGFTGGDNKGPLEPDPVYAGVLIGSENYLAADIVGTRLMGFDPLKVKMFTGLLQDQTRDFGLTELSDIEVLSSTAEFRECLTDRENHFFGFQPYPGWVGHLEI